ncbi:MAG: hypothetical protein MUO17_02235 [Dehalococcoidales bacterium]|nr:hypothetical protein [Dehalococcoidales bacterium]
MAKPLRGISQEKNAKRSVLPLWVLIDAAILAVLYVLLLFALKDWELSAFLQMLREQWYILLLLLFLAISIPFLFNLLVTWISPKFIFVVLILLGFLLLYASSNGSLFQQNIAEWIKERWNISLFSASITVLSLAFTFGVIVVGRKNE